MKKVFRNGQTETAREEETAKVTEKATVPEINDVINFVGIIFKAFLDLNAFFYVIFSLDLNNLV